ncbi:MAG: hypothetical protein Q8L69_15805 [Gallionellaceae bacterium]|nr:hypothetical protein [Gallionellaceae bacterium]
MPNTPLKAFLPRVLLYTPGCTDLMAIAPLKDAAIEFCERTKCWRTITSPTLASNGQALVTPSTATIHLIEEATWNGLNLEPVQFTDISPDELTGNTNQSPPGYITQIEPGKVQVYPFQSGGTLRVSAFLKPRADAVYNTDAANPFDDANAVVPDFLFMQDAESIAFGAIARIMAVPEHRFSNDQKSLYYRQMFDAACNHRFSRHMRGQQRAPMRVKASWM